MRRVGWLAALALGACPREEAPGFAADDRTLAALRAEQARLAQGGAPGRGPPLRPEPDPLAEAVVAHEPLRPLSVPAGATADLGPVALTVRGLEVSQTVAGPKLSLTTAERFLKLTLEAKAHALARLDLAGAQLRQGDTTVPLARDAQRAAGGSPLSAELQPGDNRELILFFEVPPALISRGLKFVLSGPESRVELALQ